MKALKIKLVVALMFAGFAFSCKNDKTVSTDNADNTDSTEIAVDSVGPNSDTTGVGNGTTGATGEGSTGSGTAGSTQQGNSTVKADSTGTNGR
jgi:hypothetical protein